MNRNIDTLGRIVIPKEMRKQLDIKENDPLNIELQDNKIIITKPDTVDYKAIVDKAIEYMKDFIFEPLLTNEDRKLIMYNDNLRNFEKILKEVE